MSPNYFQMNKTAEEEKQFHLSFWLKRDEVHNVIGSFSHVAFFHNSDSSQCQWLPSTGGNY